MLDIKFIKKNQKLIKENIKKRFLNNQGDVDLLLKSYEEWLSVKKQLDNLRRERNKASEEINQLKKQGKDAKKHIEKIKFIPPLIQDLETKENELQKLMQKLQFNLPNIMHPKVPKGKDETKNKVIKKWGKHRIPKFKLLSHSQIAEKLNLADFEQGRIVAGRGFNYLTGKLAILDLALQRYGIDFLIKKKFTPIIPPMMLNKETLEGVVDLNDFKEVIYKIENENLYLIGTAEHSLIAYFKNKTFDEKQLPIKVCAVTPCFRKEIGGHGVDMKGLFRMHQFNKVEQVVISNEKDSFKILEEMQKITEEFFKSLKIPFRVIEICSGDLGNKFARQYDIEAWFPRQKAYREVTSAGNCTNYQTNRLKIKYIDKNGKHSAHALNNTMIATSRAMVAILENFQQKNGTIKIPSVLHKYTKFKEIKPKK